MSKRSPNDRPAAPPSVLTFERLNRLPDPAACADADADPHHGAEDFLLPKPAKQKKSPKSGRPSGGQGWNKQVDQTPRRKQPKPATAKYLERYALWYLERYASSCENLRRALQRKVTLSAQAHGTDPQEGADAIEALIGRLRRIGALNDEVYARGRVQTLQRRGASRRTIRQKLAAKGVTAETITQALQTLAEEQGGNPEMTAALAYARRRRLGPYRPEAERADHRDKDMAALGRQGFAYDLVRRIIQAEDPQALEDEARLG
tara:strand:- start:2328 stop:3113 length:786 start_codon:yes stop_codon:yes gene_type:complete